MTPRFDVLKQIQTRPRQAPIDQSRRPSELFGEHVFSKKVMKHYLSKEAYLALKNSMERGETLEREVASPVANAIKSWAMDKGVTHYTHWFQPLTGRTAEKHASFLEINDGEPIDKFSGEELVQQTPDASAFPSGGLRTTFEARGYTAWDCSSPVFIFETTYGKTLCIPTIFVSYTGQALDYKTPLLRSVALLERAATAVGQLFDPEIKRVLPTLGAEQEYFLIDRAYFDLRPDLLLTGRTLFGAPSARGHQLEDHYFGAIPERVFAFMSELEQESHRLGIPLKTRHNEVAPSQFECVPQYEPINVAVDHMLMIMDLIDRTARKHHFAALLHEKPFAGLNGSGKHSNWSLETDQGRNLLSPGHDPQANLMFLAFFVSVIRAVHDHGDLLQAAIASPGNDLRLGTNEAPPPVLSVFIGQHLTKVLNDIENPPRRRRNDPSSELMHLGISEIPALLLDNTDRNRTSPFAFTGNKFELRTVGASANSSHAMTLLNAMVADQLFAFKRRVERKMNRGRAQEAAILDLIKEFIEASKNIRYEGDSYSDDWKRKAKKRKLKAIAHTPSALKAYQEEASLKLLTEHRVFSREELQARHTVLQANYLTTVRMEGELLDELVRTHILPAAQRYQRQLMETLHLSQQAGMPAETVTYSHELAVDLGSRCQRLHELLQELGKLSQGAESQKDETAVAFAYAEKLRPFFERVREQVDALERLLPDELWPLPKYREMLFVR